ncbi:MAG: hypothetical protein HN356_07080 [Calditrichaeota bacterium]|nr:hypothetical protein [Calditrichota bacterium]MBT7616874.1 hypothetical protein [Calditrichota bacterium]
MIRRTVGYILILLVVVSVEAYFFIGSNPEPPEIDLNTPSPALGQAVASAIHQTVSDPYFEPLEKLGRLLNQKPGTKNISLDELTQWATDDQLPTCFIYDVKTRDWEIDHPTSPWILDGILEYIKLDIGSESNNGKASITTLKAEGETWWLGYVRIPPDWKNPNQIAGVFFSIDQYLVRDVPRLVDNVVLRPRFPLVPFQQTPPLDMRREEGHIALRILDENGEVYLQRGKDFKDENLIYSESQWYPNPIVCMQRGWDLQVFSAAPKPETGGELDQKEQLAIMIVSIILISIIYWVGTAQRGKG